MKEFMEKEIKVLNYTTEMIQNLEKSVQEFKTIPKTIVHENMYIKTKKGSMKIRKYLDSNTYEIITKAKPEKLSKKDKKDFKVRKESSKSISKNEYQTILFMLDTLMIDYDRYSVTKVRHCFEKFTVDICKISPMKGMIDIPPYIEIEYNDANIPDKEFEKFLKELIGKDVNDIVISNKSISSMINSYKKIAKEITKTTKTKKENK